MKLVNMNLAKNEILKMRIFWNMWFWTCDFLDKMCIFAPVWKIIIAFLGQLSKIHEIFIASLCTNYWTQGQIKTFLARCLKSTEKVSFDIASYVNLLSGKCLKMPEIVNFGDFLKTWNLLSNCVTRQVSFNRTKIDEKCQNSKIPIRHFL